MPALPVETGCQSFLEPGNQVVWCSLTWDGCSCTHSSRKRSIRNSTLVLTTTVELTSDHSLSQSTPTDHPWVGLTRGWGLDIFDTEQNSTTLNLIKQYVVIHLLYGMRSLSTTWLILYVFFFFFEGILIHSLPSFKKTRSLISKPDYWLQPPWVIDTSFKSHWSPLNRQYSLTIWLLQRLSH